MKANAPEKIYVSIHSGIHHYEQKNDDDIEYTRTDAFVEKAENYLRDKCQRFILTEKDIEDFINYMKGE